MNRRITMGIVALGLLVFALAPVGAEPGKAKGKAEQAAKLRVYAPYHRLKLTDEQSESIAAIQAGYREKIRELERQEAAEIEPILTDAQREQLAKWDKEAREAQRLRAKEARDRKKAEAGEDAPTDAPATDESPKAGKGSDKAKSDKANKGGKER